MLRSSVATEVTQMSQFRHVTAWGVTVTVCAEWNTHCDRVLTEVLRENSNL